MSGKYLMYCGVALCAALAFVAPAGAADTGGGGGGGPGGKGPGGKHPPSFVEFVLKHATDLDLTADQTTKLQALADELKKNPPPRPPKPPKDQDGNGGGGDDKGHRPPPPDFEKVKEILTPEQMDKVKALHDKNHPKPPPQN